MVGNKRDKKIEKIRIFLFFFQTFFEDCIEIPTVCGIQNIPAHFKKL
jgi:hypothetical protein